jgi:hypothetical protein
MKIETKRVTIDILGTSEIKWKDEGHVLSYNYRVNYSGDKNSYARVGIILTNEGGQKVKNYPLYNERPYSMQQSPS